MNVPVPLRLRTTSHPLVYEVNTRVLLRELSAEAGKPVTLTSIPETVLDHWAELGFDAVWMMGVWDSGKRGAEIVRNHMTLQEELRKVLPDLEPTDVGTCPYSVREYKVPRSMGGLAGLRKLRQRLADRGLGLILDFIPNHSALDSPWIDDHPEYFIAGSPDAVAADPGSYFAAKSGKKSVMLAHGRDPHFPAWTDTAQLNHRHAGLRAALIDALRGIAGECDGVRCDMAMLLLEKVFRQTWGDAARPGSEGDETAGEFWKAAIRETKATYPDFLLIAEAYWNLEWELQQLGLDYTYDKKLYDRLLKEGAWSTREHLLADADFQQKSVRFIENHDEPRAAKAFSSEGWHLAAAVVIATIPGMVLIHEGQMDGRRSKIPVQLLRRPAEPKENKIYAFYNRLLRIVSHPVFRNGIWTLLNVRPAWHDNTTWQNFIAYWWEKAGEGARLVVINYAPHSGQAYVEVPVSGQGNSYDFKDLLSEAQYVRDRHGLIAKGMYFDLTGYAFHIFEAVPERVQSTAGG